MSSRKYEPCVPHGSAIIHKTAFNFGNILQIRTVCLIDLKLDEQFQAKSQNVLLDP